VGESSSEGLKDKSQYTESQPIAEMEEHALCYTLIKAQVANTCLEKSNKIPRRTLGRTIGSLPQCVTDCVSSVLASNAQSAYNVALDKFPPSLSISPLVCKISNVF
jgi:hypothetical protein